MPKTAQPTLTGFTAYVRKYGPMPDFNLDDTRDETGWGSQHSPREPSPETIAAIERRKLTVQAMRQAERPVERDPYEIPVVPCELWNSEVIE